MSTQLETVGVRELNLAEARALWDTPAHLAQRPEHAPGRVVAGLLPWGRRRKQRVIAVQAELICVRAVRELLSSACWFWGIAELGECVAACASELVANAIVHATWPESEKRRLYLIVSLSAGTLVVEVCDPDPGWPSPRAAVDWDGVVWSAADSVGECGLGLRLVRLRMAELGGEFGYVSGTNGKVVFFAVPVPRRARRSVTVRCEGGQP